MKKPSTYYTSLALAIILGLVIAGYIFGWTTPSANPPSANLPAPINTGSDAQAKEGYLAVGTSTTPSYPLDVAGAVRATTYYGDGSNLTGISSGLWSQNGSDIYYNDGYVGIGTSTPQSILEVIGDITLSTSTNTVTIKSDGSISTGLNCDKLDGYDAADLSAGSTGYIDWTNCEVKHACLYIGETTLTCSTNYTLVDATCNSWAGYYVGNKTKAYCYYSDINSLYITAQNYGSTYPAVCGSIKCCLYISP